MAAVWVFYLRVDDVLDCSLFTLMQMCRVYFLSGTPFFLERCSTFHARLSRRAVNRVLLLHVPLQRRAFASRTPSAGRAVPYGDSREYGSERSCVLDRGRARSPDPPRLALR